MSGRPSEFSQEVADTICERIAHGESLRAICRDETTPAMSTVFKWLSQRPAFAEQYALAREAQADALFDEILDIADDSSGDTKIVGRDGEEREVCDAEFVQRSRLRVDARKWMAGKLRPKVYGEKLDLGGKVDLDLSDEMKAWLGQR
jgi:hypothetical protein